MICDALVWSFNAVTGIAWLEVVKALAPVLTAVIAFTALKNWQRQDKAKREAEFLDALIEATHAYIAQMPAPTQLLEIVKLGFLSRMATGNVKEQSVKGAIAYIMEHGVTESKRLADALDVVRPSVVRLDSLATKGQVFQFDGYAGCRDSVGKLTSQFRRLEAFAAIIGSPNWNWENPEVLRVLSSVISLSSNEVRDHLTNNNAAVMDFAAKTYRRLYG
jgi:hypothetical protein